MNKRLALIAAMFGGLCQHQSVFADTVRHYEYVFIAGSISVYDTDNNFTLVKTISVPTSSGPRGAVASAVTGMLYISYGPDGWAANGDGGLIKYDLTKDQVVWNRTYSFGIDSMSISPDGSTIYMPTGENAPGGIWEVIDAATGNVTGAIDSTGVGPHNTVLNASGTHVYMAPRGSNYLVEADTSTRQILQKIGPVTTAPGTVGVRPFTINGSETLAFMTATGLLGFQVGDIATGKILYTVPINGFSWDGSGGDTAPSHGISLSPDEKEVYVVDSANSYVHVYDITGLPGSAPLQVADLPLTGRMSGVEAGCAYDCYRSGWVHHSRDGRYVFVGDSGDVIDTTTRKTVGTLSAMANSRISIEVDFQDGVPVWAMQNRTSIGTGAATAPPTPPTSGIALVQTSAAQGRAVNSLASSFTRANTAGNLIIAFVRMSTTTQTVGVTDTAGNSYTDAVSQVQTVDGHQVHIFYAKDIAGGSNTVTARFSSVNNYPWLAIYEYSGLSLVNPLDQISSAQGFGSLAATGTLQTAKATELVFVGTGFPASFKGSATSVPPFSLNQVDTGTSPAANESAIATTAGTAIQGAVNLSSGTDWTAVAAAFAAPEPSGISPSGTGSSQAFTFTYTDPNGYQDISGSQIVINSTTSGAGACYILFGRGSNAVALADDAGTPGPPTTLGAPTVLQNSQCSVLASISSQSFSRNTVTLTLFIVFKPAFAGARNVYTAFSTNAGVSSGLRSVGTFTAPVNTTPISAVSVTPGSGTGQAQAFTLKYFDPNGYPNTSGTQVLISPATSAVGQCYILFGRGTNQIGLANDTGTNFTLAPLGGQTVLQNSQCSVFAANSYQSGSGTNLSLTLLIAFKPAFAGVKNVYSGSTDNSGNRSAFVPLGTWTVPATPPALAVNSVPPSAATVSGTLPKICFAEGGRFSC